MEKNIIVNPSKFKKTVFIINRDGPQKIHFISDFDRTLTTAFVRGKPVPSLISVLRDYNLLTNDYSLKAIKLYQKYHSLEIDPKIPFNLKKRLMR